MQKTYMVKLVRPVFQVAVLEVTSTNSLRAIEKAMQEGDKLSDREWETKPFDPQSYDFHVHSIVDHQEICETSDNPHRDIDRYRTCEEKNDPVKYCLLYSDTERGDQHFVPQPWFHGKHHKVRRNICDEWSEAIDCYRDSDIANDNEDEAEETGIEDSNIIRFPLQQSSEQ